MFSDVRWVDRTGSTNADAMALLRDGAPEGIVVVADHQTAGRGRRGRTWEAPAGAGLLASIVLHPTAGVLDACTMAVAVAAAEAVHDVAGFAPRLKWPNDLVWPGDGSAPDRKLAGILAEADRPSDVAPEQRVGVVVGIGINVAWPVDRPPELADLAVAMNDVTQVAVDREELLVALLERLAGWYEPLVATGDAGPLRAAWRDRSATLGRRVRVDLGGEDLEGTAVDISDEGHLVVTTSDGEQVTVAAGDVVHLRPA